jgi:hypothetical protein
MQPNTLPAGRRCLLDRAALAVLAHLRAAPEPCVTHSRLTAATGLTVYALSRALGQLEKAGCLATLRVTPAGVCFVLCACSSMGVAA